MSKKITSLLLAMLLLVVPISSLAGCKTDPEEDTGVTQTGEPKMPEEVLLFNPNSTSSSGNVKYRNYQIVIKDGVDWDKLPDARKQAVINFAFAATWEHATANDVVNYNIIGLTENPGESGQRTVLFLWDRENNKVIIYIDGVGTHSWDAPVK